LGRHQVAAWSPDVVPFAANPVVVDRDADEVVYHDANVWIIHDLAG